MRLLIFKITGCLLAVAILAATGLMVRLTWPYTALKPGIDFLQTKVFVYHILHWRYSFYIHVFTGIFALITGITQFSRYLLIHKPVLHRIMGYLYVINVLFITGPAALIMSFYANGGRPAKISFILQSVAWLFCTAMALRQVLNKKFSSHGEWMLRSYALTLAAITLRSYAALLSIAGSDLRPVDKYIIIAWASWIPNLLLAELLIRWGYIKAIRPAS